MRIYTLRSYLGGEETSCWLGIEGMVADGGILAPNAPLGLLSGFGGSASRLSEVAGESSS